MRFHVHFQVPYSKTLLSTASTQLGVKVMNFELMLTLFTVGREARVTATTSDMLHQFIL